MYNKLGDILISKSQKSKHKFNQGRLGTIPFMFDIDYA